MATELATEFCALFPEPARPLWMKKLRQDIDTQKERDIRRKLGIALNDSFWPWGARGREFESRRPDQ